MKRVGLNPTQNSINPTRLQVYSTYFSDCMASAPCLQQYQTQHLSQLSLSLSLNINTLSEDQRNFLPQTNNLRINKRL